MIGAILGDIVGSIYEFDNIKTKDFELFDKEYNVYSKVFGFDIYCLPLEKLPESYCGKAQENAPALYKYEFEVDKCNDTLLRLSGFTRGVAFLNGFNLGRHWDVEHSENKLFIPAPLLKEGKNELVVFDVLAKPTPKSVKLADK